MNVERGKGRIILGATCFADASAAIRIAISLAGQTGRRIEAYLVEEEAILHYSSLPTVTAISAGGASSEPVTADAMREAYRHDARVYERALSDAARAAALEWSFTTERGELAATLQGSAGAGDFLLFGYQKLQRNAEGIVIVDRLARPDRQLHELGQAIAGEMGQPLYLVSIAGNGEPGEAGSAALPADVDKGSATTVIEDGSSGHAGLLRHLSGMGPVGVVVSPDLASRVGVSELLDAARCPLIVPVE